jgi:hypothetical protein
MLALTVLYSLVFCYIRGQLRKFGQETETTADRPGSSQELEPWQADLETGEPIVDPAPSQIITTQMVSVTTEDRTTNLSVEAASGIPISLRNTPSNHSHIIARRRMLQVARSLLWYPLIYVVVTAPLTIGRLSQFAGDDWPQVYIFIAATFYASAGWCNVLLYTTTRKGIVSWTWCGWITNCRGRSKPRMPSFSGPSKTPPGKYGSHNSTMTSGSLPSDDELDPREPSPSNVHRDSKVDMHFEGVDFTNSVGFDTINIVDETKVVHDRYCLQNQLDAADAGKKTEACTCKNIQTYQ